MTAIAAVLTSLRKTAHGRGWTSLQGASIFRRSVARVRTRVVPSVQHPEFSSETLPLMNPDSEVVNATIVADLPQRLFRLETEGGSNLVAGLSPQVQRLGTTFKPGDRVRVRPAASDHGRGTILGLAVEPPPSVPA